MKGILKLTLNILLIPLVLLLKIIPVEYIEISDQYEIHASIGEPFQRIYFGISLSENYTWTLSSLYYLNRSLFYSHHYDKLLSLPNRERVLARVISDDFELLNTDVKIKDFPFYILPSSVINSGISFGYKYINESFSLLNHLVKNNLVDHFSFALTKNNNGRGTLLLGGVPQREIENTFNSSCRVNEHFQSWGCDLDGVVFGDGGLYHNREYFILSSEMKKIMATNEFYDYAKKKIFGDLIERGMCYEDEEKEVKMIICYCNAVNNIRDIKLIINNYVFVLKDYELFGRLYRMRCVFNIQKFSDENRNDKWVLGYSFYQKFLTMFDYEKNRVVFYNRKPFEKFYSSSEYNKHMISSAIIINIIGILLTWCSIVFLTKRSSVNMIYYFYNTISV